MPYLLFIIILILSSLDMDLPPMDDYEYEDEYDYEIGEEVEQIDNNDTNDTNDNHNNEG